MRPRTVNRLRLADDPLLKIKPALTPSENLRHSRFSLKRTKNGVTHGAELQINLAVATAGFECKTPASLAQTTHLQNFCSRKLIQVADKGVTRIDPLRWGA